MTGGGTSGEGIRFGADELSPDEQQMEVTKRTIWKKLADRLETGCSALDEMERAKGFEPSTFTLAR